jgi:hypothetical protein
MDFEQHAPTYRQRKLYRELQQTIENNVKQSSLTYAEVIECLLNLTFDVETFDGQKLNPKDLAIMLKREV